MWPAALPVCWLLWGLWHPVPLASSFLTPDLSTSEVTQLFQDFMRRFNKSYPNKEEMHCRFKIFAHNLDVSRELQAAELGTAQYGVTRFSDLTEREFVSMFGLPQPSEPSLPPTLRHANESQVGETRKSCDWRKRGAITAVKLQGTECRSCWAFATVANIEALWNIHRHMPRNLSVQELVDCTYKSGEGCQGGFVWDALLTVYRSRGLSNSILYPYVGRKQTCQKHRHRKVTQIDGYAILPRDEKYIAEHVASKGPVTALLNMKPLQSYKKGIIRMRSEACDPKIEDHAVLIVGYDEGKARRGGSWSGPYWIIQNSWGEDWGEKGYFRMHRGTNTCGIAMSTATAIVQNSGGKKPALCPP
ncbi:cathepsin W [Rhineura floridana]|uniref:cathepsin W n=1 Tax=Rhineura floridana TaxID=261503 RepID=UPI002AC8801F|nr:cathepsin W [Rhineura floridana]